jgi:hypothetical protein
MELLTTISLNQQSEIGKAGKQKMGVYSGATGGKSSPVFTKLPPRDDGNDLVLVQWPQSDLALLRDATIQFLNTRNSDTKLDEQDRKDYSKILESLRTYVSNNYGYWKIREVPNDLRFQDWTDPDGKKSWDQNLK